MLGVRFTSRREPHIHTFSGEVWTDARGFANVALPPGAQSLQGELEYELQPFPGGVAAVITAELLDGHFTIQTDEPHVKVAWRLSESGRSERRNRD